MPRIEPIPMDALPPESRRIVEDGVAAGLYSTPVPLQLFAYSTGQLAATDMQRRGGHRQTLLGPRLLELLRIRSGQLGGCEPCMRSRKHDSITDDDVACLLSADRITMDPQEAMAIEFIDTLSYDHFSMDDAFYQRLGEHFSPAQIMELGMVAGMTIGVHRFIHTLDPLGDGEPVIKFSPDQIDLIKEHSPA
ncbi:MAG TPA: carboxymuconolactone decarboxylase family protein [Mycobacteriales bacterium]|nr:carboxymuconolactone decarboxylase family protein [Mycobacteriales bacterium]